MSITNKDYEQMNKKASPPSKSYINIPMAFLVGGLICTIGQFLLQTYSSLGMPKDIAAAATSVTLVFLSSLLTGLNVYDMIAKHAGAGTLVPITGFANAVVSPAMEFKSEGLILGLAAKMFVIAGPVLCYGTAASAICGLFIYLFGLY